MGYSSPPIDRTPQVAEPQPQRKEEPTVRVHVPRGVSDTPSSITVNAETVGDWLYSCVESIGSKIQSVCSSIYSCLFEHTMTITVSRTTKEPKEPKETPVESPKDL